MKSVRRFFTVVASVAAVVLPVAPMAHAGTGETAGVVRVRSSADDDYGRIVNRITDRCLAVQGANNVNGAPAFQYTCNVDYGDQVWSVEPVAGGYRVRNADTGRCLAVQGANNVNGAPAFQYDCTDYADQVWEVWLIYVNGNYIGKELKNHLTQRCLAVQSTNNVDGAPAFQYDCVYDDRLWYF